MDERQQQIKEGAGLEESRLNTEFIEFLRKALTPVLLVIALVSLGWVGWQRLQLHRAQQLDAAFAELGDAQISGQPAGLIAVADAHAGQRGVPHLARLAAADRYLQAARVGVTITALATGRVAVPEEGDLLTPEQRSEYLDQAASLYQRVIDDSAEVRGQVIHAVNALFGQAAVAETRGDVEAARRAYERARDLSSEHRLDWPLHVANQRLETMELVEADPTLPSADSLWTPEPASIFPSLPDVSPAESEGSEGGAPASGESGGSGEGEPGDGEGSSAPVEPSDQADDGAPAPGR